MDIIEFGDDGPYDFSRHFGHGAVEISFAGEKMRDVDAEWVMILCHCGAQRIFPFQQLRTGFGDIMPTERLFGHLTAFCTREDCDAELIRSDDYRACVSPEDGCAMEG